MKNDGDKIKVAIAEDHEILRQGLKALLSEESNLEIIFDVGDGSELIEKIKENPVDVLILDLNMPKMDGEMCMPILLELYPKLKIIILSAFYSESIVNELLKMGATCFLPKHCDFSILLDAIVDVHKNGFYSEKESKKEKKMNLELEMNEDFTPRELDILKLLCEEKTSKEIAETLFISHRTVEGHKLRIMEKTKTTSTSGIIIFALRKGYFR
jgi:DNA-binding NarL/FixJ family response regulator